MAPAIGAPKVALIDSRVEAGAPQASPTHIASSRSLRGSEMASQKGVGTTVSRLQSPAPRDGGLRLRAPPASSGPVDAEDNTSPVPVSSADPVVPRGGTSSSTLNAAERKRSSEIGNMLIPVHFLAFALVIFPLEALIPEGFLPQLPISNLSFAVGLVLVALGAPFAVQSVLALSKNLTPYVEPTKDAVLQKSGVYSIVRHPLYSSKVLVGAGLTLATGSPIRLFLTLLILLALDIKAKIEEQFLVEKFGEAYVEYSKTAKRLIPFLY